MEKTNTEGKNPNTTKHEVDVAKEQVVLENKTQGVKGQLDMRQKKKSVQF